MNIKKIVLMVLASFSYTCYTMEEKHADLRTKAYAYPDDEIIQACAASSIQVINHFLVNKNMDINRKLNTSRYAFNQGAATPLFIAAYRQHFELVQFLIDHGADINIRHERGETAVMWAVRNYDIQLFELFMSRNARLEKYNTESSVLEKCIEENVEHCSEMVTLLVQKGANPHVKNTFTFITPLMQAAINGNTDVVRFLISCNVEVDAKSKTGKTALMFAAKKGQPDIITVLLAAGASKTIAHNRGKTALDIAQKKGYQAIVNLLTSHDIS